MRSLPLAFSLMAVLCMVGCRGGERDAPPAVRQPAPAGAERVGGGRAAAPHRPHGIEIIDSHVHITPTMPALAQALEVFDRVGITRFVTKSGGSYGDPRFAATVAMKRVLGDRLEWFCTIDWSGIDEPDFAARTAWKLERAALNGAKGVKIFKDLGLGVRDQSGALVPVDDPRLAPIFEKAGEMGFIVAMHTGDPLAFFDPVTPDNERYDELSIAPSWSFYGEEFPGHDELLEQRDRLLARHPETIFLLIHLANYPEDIDYVDQLLDRFDNVWVDTSARVPEFGRHSAERMREFFVKHKDRVLFGSDFISMPQGMQLGSVSERPPGIDDAVEFYERHWEYFETDGAQIDHPTPIQGRWKVDAVSLPPEVLKKLYHDNAEWLIFSPLQPLRERLAGG